MQKKINSRVFVFDNGKRRYLCNAYVKLPTPPFPTEAVNHPAHYAGKSGIEALDVIEAFDLNFNTGNAVKYIVRAGKKAENSTVQDLKKAVFYLNREIKNLEG